MSNIIMLTDFYYENLFQGLNMSIKKNSFTTISGPNNCGKTTLMRILSRETITDNIVMIKERDINDFLMEEYGKVIQCIIPLEIIFDETTLEEEFYLYIDSLEEIENMLKFFKLNKLLTKSIKNLTSK